MSISFLKNSVLSLRVHYVLNNIEMRSYRLQLDINNPRDTKPSDYRARFGKALYSGLNHPPTIFQCDERNHFESQFTHKHTFKPLMRSNTHALNVWQSDDRGKWDFVCAKIQINHLEEEQQKNVDKKKCARRTTAKANLHTVDIETKSFMLLYMNCLDVRWYFIEENYFG